MHRFLYFPQNLLMGLYNAYYAPSDLSAGMRMLIAALPATFNKSWVISLSEDQLVKYAHMRSAEYPTPPPAPEGVSISTTNEFDDLLEGCDGEWRFHIIKPTARSSAASTSSEPAFMIYLHGGAYVSTAQPSHFTFLYDLCQRAGVTILMPIYPRPPHAKVSHKEILAVLARVIERLRGTAGQSTGEATAAATKATRFSMAGDSAGGGMAMGLVLSLIKNKKDSLLPSLVMLNAPWMDVSLSSPEMDKYDKMDPWLPIPFVRIAGANWAGSSSALKDPLASPAFLTAADLSAIKASKMRIAIFQGEADLTCPDTLVFVSKLREQKIPLDFFFKRGVPHVYPLFPKNIPEAEEARSLIASLIMNA